MVGCNPAPVEKQQTGSVGTATRAAVVPASPTASPSATANPAPTATAVPAPTKPRVASDWPLLAPEDEGFRIELPGKPDAQSSEVDTPAGKVFMRLYSLADDARRRVYSIAANRLPTKPDAAEAEAVLDRARDGAVKLVDGRVVLESKAEHDRRPGRTLVVALPGGMFVHGRMVVADDRFYQVNIVSDSEELSADDRRVFDSMRIGTAEQGGLRPQFAWRFVTPQDSTFAVEMPGDPREQIGALNTPLGKVDLRRLEVHAGPRTYFAQSCDLPMAAAASTEAKLDAARDHLLRETSGKVVEESKLTLLGSEGRALAVAFGARTMRVRTFIDGARVYQIGVVGAGDATDDDRRFFDSLRLSERPAP